MVPSYNILRRLCNALPVMLSVPVYLMIAMIKIEKRHSMVKLMRMMLRMILMIIIMIRITLTIMITINNA